MVKVKIKETRCRIVETEIDLRSTVEAINENPSLRDMNVTDDTSDYEIIDVETGEVIVFSTSVNETKPQSLRRTFIA
jgi:uncharacterized protein YkvS